MSAEVAESPVKRIKVRHRGNRAMLAKIETMFSKLEGPLPGDPGNVPG